jgi:hypothetical protein
MLVSFLSRHNLSRWDHEWHRAGLGWQRNMAVLGGGGTMPVFPLGCLALMPILHSLAIVILIGLIFHGLASQTAARSGDRPRRKALEDRARMLGQQIRWGYTAFGRLRRAGARL